MQRTAAFLLSLQAALGLAMTTVRTPSPQKLHALANRAIHKGYYPEAVIVYERVLRESPSSRTYLLKALLYERMNQWDQAREVFRSGNRLFPNDGKLLQAWGLMESRKGHATLALRLLRRSVVVDRSLAPVLKWHRFSKVDAASSSNFYSP